MNLYTTIIMSPLANGWRWRAMAYRDACLIAKPFNTHPIVIKSLRSSMRFSAREAIRIGRELQKAAA